MHNAYEENKLTWAETDFTYHNPLRGKPELNFNVGSADMWNADGDVPCTFHHQIFHVEVCNGFIIENFTSNTET